MNTHSFVITSKNNQETEIKNIIQKLRDSHKDFQIVNMVVSPSKSLNVATGSIVFKGQKVS